MTSLVMAVDKLNIQSLKSWLEKFVQHRAKHKVYKKTVAELSKLTDKELRDIGLTRGDIHSIAMETHYDNRGEL
jgi:uncharacterized protein YjiS (DUF1127 family)